METKLSQAFSRILSETFIFGGVAVTAFGFIYAIVSLAKGSPLFISLCFVAMGVVGYKMMFKTAIKEYAQTIAEQEQERKADA